MHSQRRVALPACTSVNGAVTEAWADSLECASLTAYNLQGVKFLSALPQTHTYTKRLHTLTHPQTQKTQQHEVE